MKYIKKCLIVFFALTFFAFSVVEVFAAETDSVTDSLYGYIDKYTALTAEEKTDSKVTVEEFFGVTEESGDSKTEILSEDYLDDFYSSLPEDIKEQLPKIDNGETQVYEKFSFKYFLSKLKETAKGLITPFKNTLVSILGILLISALASKVAESGKPETGQAVSTVCAAAVCISVFSSGVFDIEKTEAYLKALSDISTAIMPTVTVLLAATGNITSAALTGQSMTVLCAVLEFLFSRVVFPLVSASAGLCIAGCVLNEKTGFSLSELFRKISNFITVFSMTFLVFVMAIQSSLASAADSLGIKTVKFAVGSFVPLVGGAVSETVNAVGAGLGYIKNTCGIISLAVIFVLMLPPLLSLLFGKLVFTVSGCASGMLDCPFETKLFSELNSLCDCLIALVVSASVVFIFVLVTVISCGVKIGGF